ncbi:hypothetical protein D9M68_463850 [compost metagenome]
MRIQAPVERANQRLDHVLDDGAAARRAGAHHELAHAAVGVLLEHQRRRHRAARTLARSDAVGNLVGLRGLAVRLVREIGQLVVQQEALRHVGRPHAAFHRGGHHDHVALLVDNGEVRGAVLFSLVDAKRNVAKIAGRGGAHALRQTDEAGSALQVGLVDQRVDRAMRQRDEVCISHVLFAVGIGQALGFAHQVHTHHARLAAFEVDGGRLVQAEIEGLEDAERLHHRNAARGRRRHAAHVVIAVGAADRVAALGLVAGQVGQRGLAGRDGRAVVGRRGDADLVDDALGDVARVEGVGALRGDGVQRLGVGRVREPGAQRLRRAVGVEEVGRGVGVALQVCRGARDGGRHASADQEAVGRQRDAVAEQVFPGQLAVVLISDVEHAHGAGRADGAAARSGAAGLGCGLVVRVVDPAQVVLGGRRRRRLAPVVRLHLLRRRVVMEHEGTAAQAARLRLDQAEHGLHRHRRIDRAAAGLEHVAAGPRGQRVVRDHHVVLGVHQLVAGHVARRRLRRGRIARVARADDHGGAAARDLAAVVGGGRGRGRGLVGRVDRGDGRDQCGVVLRVVVAVAAAAGHGQREREGRQRPPCAHGVLLHEYFPLLLI